MAISKLKISNFKGISDPKEFEIRPITLFIGPNSSGKSTCIHALAALAQTVKLPNSGRPLILDDEYAQVHLGRFIEVIHSKSYTDLIGIGFESSTPRSLRLLKSTTKSSHNSPFSADFKFKSTKRTQDTYLESAIYSSSAGLLEFNLTKKTSRFEVKFNETKVNVEANYTSSLTTQLLPLQVEGDKDDAFEAFIYNESCRQFIASELSGVLYLGPFRQSPLRRYPTRGSSPTEVGAQGENSITMLANEYVQTKNRDHLKQISSWLQDMGLAKSVEVSRVGNSDLFDVSVTLPDGANLPIADLGYGMSQVLPVLAQCSFAPKQSTLLFEQPELHLNHSAAKLLSGVFVNVAKEKQVNIIAETHSKELFYGLLDQIRIGNLSASEVAIYTVERKDGNSQFQRIEIEVDENGKPDVFDPWDKNL